MLTKISAADVVLGMYIHELCGSWMEHPFWRSGFLLDSPEDLQRLKESSVTEVWIDTGKGVGAEQGQTVEQSRKQAREVLVKADQRSERSDLASELRQAIKICISSREAVMDMFGDVRMGRTVDISKAHHTLDSMFNSVRRHPGALISLVRLKEQDNYTYMHSVAVSALMIALANQMKMNDRQVREAGLAGLMHDLGKMAVSNDILDKPGKLTAAEFIEVRKHPEYGLHYLQQADGISRLVQDACLHHHEKIDGSGYPHGLAESKISLIARMAAVCDVYDAITSERPYKAGWGPAESIHKMAQWTGHFDNHVFQAFVRTVGIYPVGSLVRLASGRLAVVIEQSSRSLLVPKVKVFFSCKSRVPMPVEVVNLAEARCTDKIVSYEKAADWGFQNLDHLWLET